MTQKQNSPVWIQSPCLYWVIWRQIFNIPRNVWPIPWPWPSRSPDPQCMLSLFFNPEGRLWRQNIKREMLLQTWLWSVENGGKYCGEWRVKKYLKRHNWWGEAGFCHFNLLSGDRRGRNMELWELCWSWTADSSRRVHAAVRKPQSRVIVTSIQSLLANLPTSEGRRLWRHIKQGLCTRVWQTPEVGLSP